MADEIDIVVADDGAREAGSLLATDLSAYPILTEQVSIPSSAAGYATGQPTDIGTQANLAIQEALGWRPTRDGRGFTAALTQSFDLSEEEGRIVWWWPRLSLVAVRRSGFPA